MTRRISTPDGRSDAIDKQRKAARRNFRAGKTSAKGKGGKARFIGEREFRQRMAVILSVAGYTPLQIAQALGESKSTINNWRDEPGFQEEYTMVTQTLTASALSLLQSYAIEAVQAVVMILRTSEDDKTILEAAKEIFDRGGLPKLSRSETTAPPAGPVAAISPDAEFEKVFKSLTPEQQEEYLKRRDEMEIQLQTILTPADEGDSDETAG